jgi:hypothetical protein
VSPVLGIIASSTQQGRSTAVGSYYSLQSVTVGSAVSSVTFSNIPAGFEDLQIRIIGNSSAADNANITFNSDTGNNYTRHRLSGINTTVASSASTSMPGAYVFSTYGFPSASNYFGASIIDILDYGNVNKFKTIRALSGADINSAGGVEITSNLWTNLAAITTINVAAYAGNWNTNTRIALYGVK